VNAASDIKFTIDGNEFQALINYPVLFA